jgi:hypothetical protein
MGLKNEPTFYGQNNGQQMMHADSVTPLGLRRFDAAIFLWQRKESGVKHRSPKRPYIQHVVPIQTGRHN